MKNYNNTTNSTDGDGSYSNNDEMMLSIALKISILVLIMLFALLGNFLLVTSIIKSSRMRKSMTNLLILNLALCDILIVTSSIFGEILYLALGRFSLGELGCRLLYPISTYAVIAAVSTLMLICIDRFIATSFPFRYRWLKSRSKYALMLAHAISFCCVVPYSLHLSLTKDEDGIASCNEKWSRTSSAVYTIFLFLVEYAVPLPIIISLYTRTWMQIKQQNDDIIRDAEHRRRRNKPLDEEEVYRVRLELLKKFSEKRKRTHIQVLLHRVNAKFHLSKKKEEFSSQIAVIRHNQTVHMLKLFICIVLVFAICMLPNQIIWLYNTLNDTSIGDVPETVAYWLTYTNSVCNPIIYGIHPKFRKVYYNNFKELLNVCVELCSTGVRKRIRLSRRTTMSKSLTTGTDTGVDFGWTPQVSRRRRSNERSFKRKKSRSEFGAESVNPPVESSTDSLLDPKPSIKNSILVDFAWTPDVPRRCRSNERSFKQKKMSKGGTAELYPIESSTDSLLDQKPCINNSNLVDFEWTLEEPRKYGNSESEDEDTDLYSKKSTSNCLLVPKHSAINLSSGSLLIPAVNYNNNNINTTSQKPLEIAVSFASKTDIGNGMELNRRLSLNVDDTDKFFIVVDKKCLERLKSLNETDC